MKLTKALSIEVTRRACGGWSVRGFALIVAMLAGCAAPPVPEAKADPALISVDKAIERSRVDLPEFTATSTSKPEPAKEKGPTLSLDYAGEAKVLLVRLAAANDREFKVLGPQPHLPLFVVVNAKNAELTAVMRDVGEQFGERADLVLTNKTIEIQYRGR